jgi:spore germination protein YaaH
MRLIPPVRKHLGRSAFEVVGVYDRAGQGVDGLPISASFGVLSENSGLVDGILADWYVVDESGRVGQAGLDGQAVGFARSIEAGVWALVTLQAGSGGAAPAYLATPAVRRSTAGRLADVVVTELYDGLVIDLSPVAVTGGAAVETQVVALMEETRRAMGRRGTLGVVIPALTAPREQPFPIDPASLTGVADWIILQGWGEHWPGSRPGPMGGLEWLTGNLDALLARVGPRQVSLALPAFAYDWPVDGDQAAVRRGRDVAALGRTEGTAVRSVQAAETEVRYVTRSGLQSQAWYLDGQSFLSRVRMAKTYGLRGVVLWRLGDEDDSWWMELGQEVVPER